jgi:hypothetical protein
VSQFVDWQAATALIAFVTSLIAVGSQWRERVIAKAKADSIYQAAVEASKANDLRCTAIERDLAEYKLLSSQHYATSASLERIEGRLFQALDGVSLAIRDLGSRLDRVLENRRD